MPIWKAGKGKLSYLPKVCSWVGHMVRRTHVSTKTMFKSKITCKGRFLKSYFWGHFGWNFAYVGKRQDRMLWKYFSVVCEMYLKNRETWGAHAWLSGVRVQTQFQLRSRSQPQVRVCTGRGACLRFTPFPSPSASPPTSSPSFPPSLLMHADSLSLSL